MTLRSSVNQLIIGTAIFIVVFDNVAFFQNVLSTFGDMPGHMAHALSLGLLQLCVLIIVFALTCFGRASRFVLAFALIVGSITAYFMDSYNVIIDHNMLVNALNTDAAESRDLLSVRFFLYLALLGVLPSLMVFLIGIQQENALAALRSRIKLAAGALLVALALIFLSSGFYASFFREHKPLRYYTNPTTPIYSAVRLAVDQYVTAPLPFRKLGEDARRHPKDRDRELVVMVVGETARADRFSLNGYSRDTNPKLAKEDLVSFNAVTACGTSTAISVPCMFSAYDQSDFSIQKANATENVLDILARTGVSVLWRDNNSSSKGVANRLPYENFRSPELNTLCDVECRDEGMLIGLQAYIDSQANDDILIVLHQMGSHGPAYFKRYPAAFRVFQPTCETNQLGSCTKEEIGNTFDNTILYTDHFLSRVIELLKHNDDRFETAMLYVSDHGESLGESGLYLHGLPNFIAPDSQTQVPLIIWLGKHFDGANTKALRLLKLKAPELSHDNIFHTMLGMFEVDTTIYDPQKDLLSLARKRAGISGEFD